MDAERTEETLLDIQRYAPDPFPASPNAVRYLSLEKRLPYVMPLESADPIPVFMPGQAKPYMGMPALKDQTGRLITFTHNGTVEISASGEKN